MKEWFHAQVEMEDISNKWRENLKFLFTKSILFYLYAEFNSKNQTIQTNLKKMFKLADILNIKLLKYRSDGSNSMVLQCNDTGGAVANTTQRRALWCIFQSTADSMGPDQAHWSLSPCSAFVNPVECQQNQILCGSLLTELFFWSV